MSTPVCGSPAGRRPGGPPSLRGTLGPWRGRRV